MEDRQRILVVEGHAEIRQPASRTPPFHIKVDPTLKFVIAILLSGSTLDYASPQFQFSAKADCLRRAVITLFFLLRTLHARHSVLCVFLDLHRNTR